MKNMWPNASQRFSVSIIAASISFKALMASRFFAKLTPTHSFRALSKSRSITWPPITLSTSTKPSTRSEFNSKPWLSRGLGAGLGLVVAIVLIYCCSLGVNLLASAQAKGQNTGDIASYLHLTGDDANNYWSLAKWLATQSFLYEQIMNFLGYAPVIASSLGSASSALTSSGSAMVSSLSTSL